MRIKMTLAVDFDGTLCSNVPDLRKFGDPIIPAIETLKKLREEHGCELILWTCREGLFLERAVQFCHKHGLFFDAVNTNVETPIGFGHPKVIADFYLDDRTPGWHELDDKSRWDKIYNEIVTRMKLTPANIIKDLTP